jgi:hypothetical protein
VEQFAALFLPTIFQWFRNGTSGRILEHRHSTEFRHTAKAESCPRELVKIGAVRVFSYMGRGALAMAIALTAIVFVMSLTGAMILFPVPMIAFGSIVLFIAEVRR